MGKLDHGRSIRPVFLPLRCFPSDITLAQQVDESAVAAFSDAFDKAVGGERTELYTSDDVRGFSPVDAGNARIDGLYFDQVDRLPQRLRDGSTIHVSISAQHYAINPGHGNMNYWTGGIALARQFNDRLMMAIEAKRSGAAVIGGNGSTALGIGAILQLKKPFRLIASGGPTFEDGGGAAGCHTFVALGLDL
jgi:hypothetical protein